MSTRIRRRSAGSLSPSGGIDPSPFSAFTFFSTKPPMAGISVGHEGTALKDIARKDTTNTMTTSPSPAADLLRLLAPAARIAVLTGAGMSAESGIPTFRGARNGLWARFDPQTLATPEAYRDDRALVWGWYCWRTALVEQARPHAGHRALAALEQSRPGVVVVTQNVDDLHERAGSRDVVHLHGSLFAPRCFDCGRPHPHAAALPDAAQAPALRVAPPACTHCGGPIRPGVVWFGEALPQAAWRRAEAALETCDALLVVGTSGVVHPAAGLPELARRHGKPVVEINPQPSALTPDVEAWWQTTAAEGLPV
ncbi:MAG: NAD-dependent deacetylase, partial [Lautropia sp.]